jgi:hypothetical protein
VKSTSETFACHAFSVRRLHRWFRRVSVCRCCLTWAWIDESPALNSTDVKPSLSVFILEGPAFLEHVQTEHVASAQFILLVVFVCMARITKRDQVELGISPRTGFGKVMW